MQELNIGRINVNVEHISSLKDINQDLANSLATGPQDMFFTSLDRFNELLNMRGIDPIDVTNKWNWKPGSYDKVKEYMSQQIHLHKKSNGMWNLIDRTKQRANYLDYINRIAKDLETTKMDLKRLGVSRDVDVDEFQEKTTNFVINLEQQTDTAYDASNGKVDIRVFFHQSNNARNASLYYEIVIRNMEMSVFNGRETSKLIQKIDLGEDTYLRIVTKIPFRHVINKMQISNQMVTKGYLHSYLPIQHPYISAYGDNYNTVCYDKFADDIMKCFKDSNMVALQHHLLSWSQYYHTNHSNPYNPIHKVHIGMPDYYNTEYHAVVNDVKSSCAQRMASKYETFSYDIGSENAKKLLDACHSVKCKYINNGCHLFELTNMAINIDEDYLCQIEAMVGYLYELHHDSMLASSREYPSWSFIDALTNQYGINIETDTGFECDQLLSASMWSMRKLFKKDFDHNTHRILKNADYWTGEPDNKEERVQQQMLQWATNNGRRS